MNRDLDKYSFVHAEAETEIWTNRSSEKQWFGQTEVQNNKGIINLAMRDLQELQETAHMKSYRVDTSTKCTECIFQYENNSCLLIRCC